VIRWYDWLFAILLGDLILANLTLALVGPEWWLQLVGSLGAALLYDLWINVYCRFRLKMEMKND
jgi:hypothetical protein